jgi:acyl dehydratase
MSEQGPAPSEKRPLYLEDVLEGATYVSPARTITEADVVAFAGLSGDYNPIHTDIEFAKQNIYGQRVVYGILAMAMMTGLLDRTGLFSGSAIAAYGFKEWSFRSPLFIGDTIHFELTIGKVRPHPRQTDRGSVQRFFEIVNQHDEVVQSGRFDTLLRRRDSSITASKSA